MKAKFITAVMAFSFSLQAQFEPFDQFFYKTLWEKLPAYDSITIWTDSLSPASIMGTYSLTSTTPGLIDTMHYTESSTGPIYFYRGRKIGNTHVVVSYYANNDTITPYARTSFVSDKQGLIKEVHQAIHNGMIFEEQIRLTLDYLPNRKLKAIHMDMYNGSTYIPTGVYNYYYGTHGLDSVLTTYNFSGRVVEKYQPVYNTTGIMTGMKYFEDLGTGDSLTLLARYEFQYAGAEIQYVNNYIYFPHDSTFKLVEIFRYGKKNKGPLDLSSNPIVEVKVYPNPVSDLLTVEGADLKEFRLLNLSGQQLMTGPVESTLNLSSLKPGTYLLYLMDSDGNAAVQKIVKR